MKTFTIIAYILSAGGHYAGTSEGVDASDAVVRLREKLKLQLWDLEVVAVVEGSLVFERLDGNKVALAPYRGGA